VATFNFNFLDTAGIEIPLSLKGDFLYTVTTMIPTEIKVFLPAVLSFVLGILLTPFATRLMYKYRMWKRVSRKENPDPMSPVFEKLHNEDAEIRTPRVGGILIWGSVLLTTFIFWLISKILPIHDAELDFVSRSQTWIPLVLLAVGGLIGLFEDSLEIFGTKKSIFSQGLSKKYLITVVVVLALLVSCWFYFKLGMVGIIVPFFGYMYLGWLFIPLFVIVTLGTFSSRVIDGVDGLAGGVMAIVFGVYGVISFFGTQYDIATLCFVITGGILAFLWFNVPPARFYMGETGMLSLTLTLSAVVFLTDQVLLLPVVGCALVATALSSFIQITSKKYFGKKVFRIAPLHHHFEALGWSREKITMRYWILSLMAGVIAIIIALVG
jgi:phospho-N-acetylmuramoyl-pentapeptide-transferase